jgi:GT2 family glycosyltransferase
MSSTFSFDLSIIIVNYFLSDSINNLINSITQHIVEIDYEIIVVDNNSDSDKITSHEKVAIYKLDKNYGFGYANNRGAEISKGEYLLFLNPDTLIIDNTVQALLNELKKNKKYGIVGPKVINHNGKIQISALPVHGFWNEISDLFGVLKYSVSAYKFIKTKKNNNEEYKVGFLFGSFLMMLKKDFNKINGFDENFFLFAEETDLCLRLKKVLGKPSVFYNKFQIIHYAGKITNKIPMNRIIWGYESKLYYYKKHFNKINFFLIRLVILINLTKKLTYIKLIPNENKNDRAESIVYLLKLYFKGVPKLNASRK